MAEDHRIIELSRSKLVGLVCLTLLILVSAFSIGVRYGRYVEGLEHVEAAAPRDTLGQDASAALDTQPKVVSIPATADHTTAETNAATEPEASQTSPAVPVPVVRVTGSQPTAPEKIPAAVAPEKEPRVEKTAAAKKGFAIQAGAFRERDQAQAMVKKLKNQGFKAYEGPTHFGSTGKWYRVWVGEYASRESAKKDLSRLSSKSRGQMLVVSRK